MENIIEKLKEFKAADDSAKEMEETIQEAIRTIQEQQIKINGLQEQLQMFIPRRRVRRVYKMLGKILRTDIDPAILEKELKQK